MGLERDIQTEVYRTFNQFGWGMKLQSDAEVCNYCHRVNHPKHTGMPDYHFEIYKYQEPQVIKIEVKAGTDRFNFSELRKEQREWMEIYSKRYDPYHTWLWIQLGTKPVDSLTPERRQAYLMTYEQFIATESLIETLSGYKFIPSSWETQKDTRLAKYDAANANAWWDRYKLEWIGDRRWVPPPRHDFWQFYDPFYRYEDIKNGKHFSTDDQPS